MPELKAQNKTVICYMSVGTVEPFRADVLANASAWKAVALNNMTTWDEAWIDISMLDQLKELMSPRFENAALAGCDGIEPDNSDCYANPTCYMNITAAAGSAYQAMQLQIEYNTWQVTKAREQGLLIGLKNSLQLVSSMASLYDFAVNEECVVNDECGLLTPFTTQGKAIFNVEYELSNSTCSEATTRSLSSKIAHALSYGSSAHNAIAHNAIAYNAIAYNSIAYNSIAHHSIAHNAIAYNSITDNGITHHGITHHGITYNGSAFDVMPPNTTFANLAWGWAMGGQDSTRNMDAIMVDLDTMDETRIAKWREGGKQVVCYFSAGSRELHRTDVLADPAVWQAAVLNATEDTTNAWLDIGNLTQLQALMIPRLDRAVARGCSAIEPDFMDCALQSSCTSYLADPSRARADQLVYNRWLSGAAHARGLLVALKNALGLIDDLVDDFDWAINEQCLYYDECGLYAPFHAQNKSIWVHHYSLENETQVCLDAQELSIQLKYCDGGNHSVNDICETGQWMNCFNSSAEVETSPPADYVAPSPVPWADLAISFSGNSSELPALRPSSRVQSKTTTTYEERTDNVTGVKIVLVDLHNNATGAVNAELVQELVSADTDRRVVCTFSAGLRESWRPDDVANPETWAALTSTQKSRNWLDIRTTALRTLMGERIAAASAIGCDGVLPLHVYCHMFSSCRRAFSLSREEADASQYAYNDWLASRAASFGLIVGLHADAKLSDALASKFHFALAEGCISRGNCWHYMSFLESGMPVFNREYDVNANFCTASEAWGVSTKMCTGDSRAQRCDANSTQTNCFELEATTESADSPASTQGDHALALTPFIAGMLGAAIACVAILVYRRHRRKSAAAAAKRHAQHGSVSKRQDHLVSVEAAVPAKRARPGTAV
ncbi:Hypothetical Protein FCC1311_078012 [Hondaea fermentalgiana]|uniref:Glycoside-hydrolase family GH114 TIM-barrel domain-containing protein n=1 Tax=Hondaea fermentalgiana TaxID=2315210 RepID=A0A2R5GL18_9STRA|nr:Hypothetical Protein FCC1311_078012 [Hondaea fermentalgiana]|eukprot:GBG31577.1 Hypothetical Protein FCC1311_078012 [Hondaea fermentalgiana]